MAGQRAFVDHSSLDITFIRNALQAYIALMVQHLKNSKGHVTILVLRLFWMKSEF